MQGGPSPQTSETIGHETLAASNWQRYLAYGAGALALGYGAKKVLDLAGHYSRANNLLAVAQQRQGLPYPRLGIFDADQLTNMIAPSFDDVMGVRLRRGQRGGVPGWHRPTGRGGRLVRTALATALIGGTSALKTTVQQAYNTYTMNDSPFQPQRGTSFEAKGDYFRQDFVDNSPSFPQLLKNRIVNAFTSTWDTFKDVYSGLSEAFNKVMSTSSSAIETLRNARQSVAQTGAQAVHKWDMYKMPFTKATQPINNALWMFKDSKDLLEQRSDEFVRDIIFPEENK